MARLDHETVARLLAEGAECPAMPRRTAAVWRSPYRHQSWYRTVLAIAAAWPEPPDLSVLDHQPPDCDPNAVLLEGDWVDCAL